MLSTQRVCWLGRRGRLVFAASGDKLSVLWSWHCPPGPSTLMTQITPPKVPNQSQTDSLIFSISITHLSKLVFLLFNHWATNDPDSTIPPLPFFSFYRCSHRFFSWLRNLFCSFSPGDTTGAGWCLGSWADKGRWLQ